MMKAKASKYSIDLSFEEIKLPPFQEILVLGKNSEHGKVGIFKSFELLAPNGFEVIEVNDHAVEAVFINKRILKKIDREHMLNILMQKVFPMVSEGEIVKVDVKVAIHHSGIEQPFEE
jgi:hypothetical protein